MDPHWKENGIADLQMAEEYLGHYRYSSYPDYLGRARTEAMLVNKEALPEYFQSPEEFFADAKEWLTYRPI